MTIRALLFDLWGTLIHVPNPGDEAGSTRKLAVRVSRSLAESGHAYSDEHIDAVLMRFREQHSALHEQGKDISTPERLERLLELVEPGLPQRISPEAFVAFEHATGASRLDDPPFAAPGALDALNEARSRDLAVGLVSITGMTPGYVLRQLMADIDLLEYIDVLTFSDEARLAKPAPEVYHCTLEALGVEASDAVFIGDSPVPDIDAPQQLGMTAIQVGDREEGGVTPDARIDSLDELFPALRRLGLLD